MTARPCLSHHSGLMSVYLVEDAAIRKMFRLGALPDAEQLVDRKKANFWELIGIFRGNFRITRSEIVLSDSLLRFGRIEIVKISFGNFAIAFLINHAIHKRDGRLGQDGNGRPDDLEPVGAELLEREHGLI